MCLGELITNRIGKRSHCFAILARERLWREIPTGKRLWLDGQKFMLIRDAGWKLGSFLNAGVEIGIDGAIFQPQDVQSLEGPHVGKYAVTT
jgi:hypothetical protein